MGATLDVHGGNCALRAQLQRECQLPVGRAAPHTKLPHTFGAGCRTSATDDSVSSLCGRVQRGTVAPRHFYCSTVDAEADLAKRINIHVCVCIHTYTHTHIYIYTQV